MLQKTEPIKILIAPDSFKECLSAQLVAKSMEQGIKKVCNNVQITNMPIADGGEGFLKAIVGNTKSKVIKTNVCNPIGKQIESSFAIIENKQIAVIEIANVVGLNLLKQNERNPLITSTYGVGQLIKKALNHDCKKIIVGIGGSATNDCGVGMLTALGIEFYDKNKVLINKPNGGNLNKIAEINISKLDPRFSNVKITVACDVKNTLTGKNGASQVYAIQKGATKQTALLLDKNIKHFAQLIKKQFGIDVENIQGAGAAGGLGAGLVAFFNAKLKSGFDIVKSIVGLEEAVKNSDLVFTGEGKIDEQTLFGKTPFGVAQLTQKHKKILIAICGTLEGNNDNLSKYGFNILLPIANKNMSLNDSIKNAPMLIEQTVQKAMKLVGKEYETNNIKTTY